MQNLNIIQNKFNDNEGNIKDTWRTINDAIQSKHRSSNTIILKENDRKIESKEVPNSFINYFTGIADKLTNQLPTSIHNASSYLKDRINNTFIMNPISKEEIAKALLKQKYNGKGTKTISTMVLKNNVNKLSEIL